MARIKIGVRLESFGLPLRKALQESARLELNGIKIDAVRDLDPKNLSQSGRREFRNILRTHELALAAVNCPLRYGFDTAENLEPRLEHVRQVMSLAFDLGPRIVTVQAGAMPADKEDPRFDLMREALTALGSYGDRIGTLLALETGLESAKSLVGFLDQIDSGSLGINFDPANLLINGFPPFEDLQSLSGRITQVQAKDARRSAANRSAQEVSLGYGELDWMLLAAQLEGMEYGGYVILQPESGERSVPKVAEGIGFLRRFFG